AISRAGRARRLACRRRRPARLRSRVAPGHDARDRSARARHRSRGARAAAGVTLALVDLGRRRRSGRDHRRDLRGDARWQQPLATDRVRPRRVPVRSAAWLAALAACGDAPCEGVASTCIVVNITSESIAAIDTIELDIAYAGFHATATSKGEITALPLST